MADRPRRDDWWLASDGKWYPPELASGGSVPTPDATAPRTAVPSRLTVAASIALGVTSVLFVVSGFFGLRVASDLRSGVTSTIGSREATTSEIAFGGWLSFSFAAFAVAAVLVIVWIFSSSRSLDARGATHRRWRGGWIVGGWLIPLANLVIPKLLVNELEKGLQVPYRSAPITDSWKTETRTTVADVWWLSWVGGVVVGQVASVTGSAEGASDAAVAAGITMASIALLLFAIAGVCLLLVIRRMETFSKR